MTVFDRLVQRLGEKKLRKYFSVDKSVGITYTAIAEGDQTTQSVSQLYCDSSKSLYYVGDGETQEIIGDFRVSGLKEAVLNMFISSGLRELGKRRPFSEQVIQDVNVITEWNYPDDCMRVKKVELDGVKLYERKVVWEGNKQTVISNLKFNNVTRKAEFNDPVTGSLSVDYYKLPLESDLGSDMREAVLNYATAMALREIAVKVRREKNIKMDGIPEISDNADELESSSDEYMARFESAAQMPYGVM